MIRRFTDLDAWKESHQLVIIIYDISSRYPPSEKFNLVSQTRRAVVSITNNVAEGFGRFHYKDRLIFYYDSRGSVLEVQNCLLAARDTGVLKFKQDFEKAWNQSEKAYSKINGLIAATGRQIKK